MKDLFFNLLRAYPRIILLSSVISKGSCTHLKSLILIFLFLFLLFAQIANILIALSVLEKIIFLFFDKNSINPVPTVPSPIIPIFRGFILKKHYLIFSVRKYYDLYAI